MERFVNREVENELILASAGSGKTYQLTNRYVRLMALGVDPRRVIALTFTRKAAGEFFGAVFVKLASAAASDDVASRLSREIAIDEADSTFFLRALRRFVDCMSELNLGTLDGFFARALRGFSLELGLTPSFRVLDSQGLDTRVAQAQRDLFKRGRFRSASRESIIEALKQSTFGAERASLADATSRILANYHEVFLDNPQREVWGQAGAVWGAPANPWLDPGFDLEQGIEQFMGSLESSELSDKQRARFGGFCEELRRYGPGAKFGANLDFVIKKVLDEWRVEPPESMVIDRKKWAPTLNQWEALRRLVAYVVFQEFETRIKQTQGIYETLAAYEAVYDVALRKRGYLKFSDIPRLLCGSLGAERSDSGGRGTSLLESRDLEYRLDSRFDHWALDEFQDTSRRQLRVIEPLIDEVVQDSSGQRSLFVVGDVKQAIYRWRGGEAGLFDELLDRYNQGPESGIKTRPLNESWRSAPEVVEFVNQVFPMKIPEGVETLRGAIEAWPRARHVSKRTELSGYAAVVSPNENDDSEYKKWGVVASVLKTLAPAQRGLSVGVLLRRNKSVEELANHLRQVAPEIEISSDERRFALKDNALCCLILSILRMAAHPADQLSGGVVQMSPFWRAMEERDWGKEDLRAWVLGKVNLSGFGATARAIRDFLLELEWDVGEFSNARLNALLDFAEVFDESGNRRIDDFLKKSETFVKNIESRPGVTQLMTIHKSKGLGFDVVIAPELDASIGALANRDLIVSTDARKRTEWILTSMPKVIGSADGTYRRALKENEFEERLEALSLLYVAVTRAKQGLYLIVDTPKATSKAENLARYVTDVLGLDAEGTEAAFGKVLYSLGDPAWYASRSEGDVTEKPAAPIDVGRARALLGRRRIRVAPSIEQPIGAFPSFSTSPYIARARGVWVHEAFRRIEWLDEKSDAGDFEISVATPTSSALDVEVLRREVLSVIRAKEIRPLFLRESEHDSVWRERAFEALVDGRWVTGVFDRVNFRCDSEGQARRAQIVDYKTDRIESDLELEAAIRRHIGQMKLYYDVVPKLRNEANIEVEAWLVFTRSALAIRLSAESLSENDN